MPYFRAGGGGADTSIVTAGANDIVRGKVIVDANGNPLTGTLPLADTTASAGNIVRGKVIVGADGNKITGTLPLADTTAGAGHVWKGKKFVNASGSLVTGTMNVDGVTATAGLVLEGHTFIDKNGSLVNGTMKDNGVSSIELAPGQSINLSGGYYGSTSISAQSAWKTYTFNDVKVNNVQSTVANIVSGYPNINIGTQLRLPNMGNIIDTTNYGYWMIDLANSMSNGLSPKTNASFITHAILKIGYSSNPYISVHVVNWANATGNYSTEWGTSYSYCGQFGESGNNNYYTFCSKSGNDLLLTAKSIYIDNSYSESSDHTVSAPKFLSSSQYGYRVTVFPFSPRKNLY